MKGVAKEFSVRWDGPFIVKSKLGPVNYRLTDRESDEDKGSVNIKNLKLYHDRPTNSDSFACPTPDASETLEEDSIPPTNSYSLRPRD
jgi:hypothetical protein